VFQVYSVDEFPLHAEGLQAGLYSYTDRGDFRAGSYSGYGEWRNWLSTTMLGMSAREVWAAWGDDVQSSHIRDRGIAWLVNFSDCEGYISAPVAARILADMEAHFDAALAAAPDRWYADRLIQWITALRAVAPTNGVIEFA
jgi:hypothetical protein